VPRVYVSIGSNVEPERNVRAAVRTLKEIFPELAASPVFKSRAEGFDGDDFYNLAASFDTDESPERLADRLGQIEAAQGRVRVGGRFSPRTLDIDILLYGDLVRHDSRFDIPRHDVLAYAHVLGPLVALAPNLRHPETGELLMDRWKQFTNKDSLREISMDFGEI
jgi:2-amino-4-hydroxy-6-hydroxymethyldihydropteridine diphosphokinase